MDISGYQATSATEPSSFYLIPVISKTACENMQSFYFAIYMSNETMLLFKPK